MKLNPWAKCIKVRTLFFILVAAMLPSASQAAFKSSLQGQNAGSTNWTGGPLTGYKELDFVPARTLFTGGPATNQVITVDFDHSKSSGTLKGIEDLSNFTNSSNVLITSGPTLSTPNTDIWRYTFTITITNALDGFVEFRARLAAGSHLFTGSSLNLSSPTLSIFKPSAEPGFPDLSIAKRGPSQAKPGQIITYTINYTNLASAATVAKGVQVSDVLPSAVTYVPGSASKGATLVGNTLTWDLGNINPGKRGLLTYKVIVATNIPITTTFANFAQILGSQDDANTADNTASVTTTVVVNPTLVANDDFYATDKYIPLSIPAPGVLTNDVSSVTNALTAVLVSIPDNGSLVFNADGSFLYTPLTNFVGVDQFAYVITVGTNTSGPAVVNINVTNSCDILVTNITVGNDAGQCGAIVNFAPTPTGLCAPVFCAPTNGSFFAVGTTSVTCSNADGIIRSITVTVQDRQAPTISCPSNLVVAANSGCNATNVTLGTPITADNCGVAIVSNNAPAALSLGTNSVTWTVVDTSGNTASCQQLVVVRDQTPPTITCPANVDVAANSGCNATNVNLGTPVTADNCSGVTTVSNNAPAIFPSGTNLVTWTAVDASGNTAICQQLVVVHEPSTPTITCPADILVAANSGCGATNVSLGTPVTGDVCTVASVTNNAPAFFPVGTNVVTWTVRDASGNSASCLQRVIVRDQTPPTITCPTNVVVNANSGCNATNVALGTPVTADNCSGAINATNNAPASFPTGTNVVTWTAIDASGNTATCQQLVVVHELTPPTITCPPNVIVAANSGCAATNVNLGTPVTADSCGVASVTNDAPASFPLGTNVVTWTVADVSGNTANCQQLVVVRDQTPPTITCPANVIVAANSGCAATNVALGTPVTTDNCAVSVTNNAPASFPLGTNAVTWTVTDAGGNTANCQQLVIVRDQTPPTITCPTNVDVTANSGCNATNVALGAPVTADNCGIATVTNNAPSIFPSGTNLVTWTAVDNSGNTSFCQQLVIVHEPSIPTITCPANVIVAANSGCGATNVPLGVPVTGAVCAVASVTNNAPALFPVGTNVVIWTVKDNSGNTATCQQLVVVRDLTPPTITCPSNLVVAANSGCNATNVALGVPVTTDNCAVTVTNNAPASLPLGTNIVTWTATDVGGNTASCQQLVVVRDLTPPAITCPPNIVVSANSGCNATNVALGTPVTADNCSGVASLTNNAPAIFPSGTNLVTWTVTDTNGNTATCQQLVVVNQPTIPTITCPADIVVAANSGCGATNVALGTPVTGDVCAVASITNNAPPVFPVGTNLVTWTVKDNSGNTAVCQQSVIVRDQTPPTIVCRPPVLATANSGCVATNVTLVAPVTADNCGVASVTNNAPAAFPVGTNLVTWTVRDASGNTATCQQQVIVTDQTPPTITCPPTAIVAVNSGCNAANVILNAPITADNCGIGSVTNNSPGSFPLGTNSVTWTVSDTSGNTATCQQLVVVRDLTPPTITCPPNLVVAANSGCNATNLALGVPVTSDNCGVGSISNNAPASFPAGTNIVTWTVRDTSGNNATCQQQVVVRDQTPPTITCPPTVIVAANSGCNATNVVLGAPVAGDNCALASVTNNAPASFPLGTNAVTWTATDSSGNTATCQQLVVVRDQTPPTITCPPTVFVAANSGCNATNVVLGTPVTADACGIATVTNSAPASFAPGTNSVTWTAVDNNGNAATCLQLVVVRDQTPPTITCPPNLVVAANSGCNATNVALGVPVTSDNCGVGSISNNAPASFPAGTNVVTWTVRDTSGNTATCQQQVVVRDQSPPTITCPATVIVAANSGCNATNVVLGAPVAGDNCALASVTNNAPASFPSGTNAVTWTATDSSGNTATCLQQVVVRDQTPPALTCPANIVRSTDPGQCSASNITFTAIATDACSTNVTVTFDPPSGSTFPKGITTVTSTARDASGNSSSCTFTVTVNDTERPTIICPANTVVSATFGQNSATVGFSPNVSDNCPGVTSTCVPPSGANFPVGVTTVVCRATDGAGNTNACSFTITVIASVTGSLVADFLTSPMVLNRQTGLFEQSMRLRNTGATTVNASRVYVLGLPSTNSLFNRNGAGTPSGSTNIAPFVQDDLPLPPGSNVVFLLEYFIPDLKAITNQTLLAEQVAPVQPPGLPPGAQSVPLQAGRDPLPLANGRFLIEWAALVGRTYTVQYSSDMTNWKTAVQAIVAAGTAVQWLDDGPPKTESKPNQAAARFYRVFLLPAN